MDPDPLLFLPSTRKAVSSSTAPASSDWLSAARAEIARREYFLATDHAADGVTAPNRAQGLRSAWHDGTLTVRSRVDPTWTFRYSLLSVGRAYVSRPQADPMLDVTWEEVSEGKIEWRRGASVSEWYTNDERGIEQFFRLDERPPGPLESAVAIDAAFGGLLSYPAEDGQSILLRTAAGKDALRIRGLAAWDANDQPLAACLSATPGLLTILVDDSKAVYPITIDPLITPPVSTYTGGAADDELGESVATAGDVNGDGFSDVIVGVPGLAGGGTDRGGVFVFLGSDSGLDVSPDWSVTGTQNSSFFGWPVASAGDVDADGDTEVLVGAILWDNGNTDEGAAFLFEGDPVAILSSSPDWTKEGDDDDALFGVSLGTAGDVDGDGDAEVIVGCHLCEDGDTDEGVAFVYLGSGSGLATTASWKTESDQAGAKYGYSVATAGDVDGDGYSDVIVGAPEYGNGCRLAMPAFQASGKSWMKA